MKKLTCTFTKKAKEDYPIFLGVDIYKKIPELLKKLGVTKKLLIITDKKVEKLYGESLLTLLKKNAYEVDLVAVPSGESSKSEMMKRRIEQTLFKGSYGRDSTILALGGGVVGDLAGFTAATYLRGVPFIQIPTSLLAMVDSSIGGKVGINTSYGKNTLGAFHQPKAVIIDLNCLKTLSKPHLLNGLMEALKMFTVLDAQAFMSFKKNKGEILKGNLMLLEPLIQRAIELKIKVVSSDEKEKNERRILNFGHTVGHALEKLSNYKMLHGFAVAYGMQIEAKLALDLGYFLHEDYLTFSGLLNDLGFNLQKVRTYSPEKIIRYATFDKKMKNKIIHCVLLKQIGAVFKAKKQLAHPVAENTLLQTINNL